MATFALGEPEYTFRAVLRGLSPLLMSHPRGMSPDDTSDELKSSRVKKAVISVEDEAEGRVYRDAFGALYVPTLAIGRAMVEAAKQFQNPLNKRSTMAKEAAACIYLPDYEGYTLSDGDGEPLEDYDVSTMRAVNKTTKGAILVSRPKVNPPWFLNLEFQVDKEVLSPEVVARFLQTAGKKIGILAFRPEKLGPYGRFTVEDFGAEGYDA